MKNVWVLTTEDNDWYFASDKEEIYQCVIVPEYALQFARKKDAEKFLEYFNNLGLDTSDVFKVCSCVTV